MKLTWNLIICFYVTVGKHASRWQLLWSCRLFALLLMSPLPREALAPCKHVAKRLWSRHLVLLLLVNWIWGRELWLRDVSELCRLLADSVLLRAIELHFSLTQEINVLRKTPTFLRIVSFLVVFVCFPILLWISFNLRYRTCKVEKRAARTCISG